MENFKERIARVKAFIFDVDGVLTDGKIIPTLEGDFMRQYNAKDGYAIAYAIREGYQVCIISGGRGKTLQMRMEALKIKHIYIDCMDKSAALADFFAKSGCTADECIYMGDDIPDLEVMGLVGTAVAPADAVAEIIEVAHYTSQFAGGCGCVRDIIEQTLRSQGCWAKDSKGVTGSDSAMMVASR